VNGTKNHELRFRRAWPILLSAPHLLESVCSVQNDRLGKNTGLSFTAGFSWNSMIRAAQTFGNLSRRA